MLGVRRRRWRQSRRPASPTGAVQLIDEVVDLPVNRFDREETVPLSFGLRQLKRGAKRGARLFLALPQADPGGHHGGPVATRDLVRNVTKSLTEFRSRVPILARAASQSN